MTSFIKTATVPLILAAFIIPAAIQANERAITVDSLEKAYTSRIEILDTGIATTSKELIEVTKKLRAECTRACVEVSNDKTIELSTRLNMLKFERRSITPAYNLLVEALR